MNGKKGFKKCLNWLNLLNLTWNSLLIFKNAGGIVKKVRIRKIKISIC